MTEETDPRDDATDQSWRDETIAELLRNRAAWLDVITVASPKGAAGYEIVLRLDGTYWLDPDAVERMRELMEARLSAAIANPRNR